VAASRRRTSSPSWSKAARRLLRPRLRPHPLHRPPRKLPLLSPRRRQPRLKLRPERSSPAPARRSSP
jgi:hypothetical protein